MILGFILLLLILTIVSGVVKSRWSKSLYSHFWRGVYYFLLTNTVIGLLLTFFNYEMVPFLSARFWILLWGLAMAVWLFFIYKMIANIPQKKQIMQREKEFKKYVP